MFYLFLEPTEKGMKFIEDGVRELLKARRVLCGSYVYGYYLEDDGYNKTIFEFMQVCVSFDYFQILKLKQSWQLNKEKTQIKIWFTKQMCL